MVNPHRIVLLRSRDQGHTWSEPKVVWMPERTAERYSGFESMTVLRSGRILAVIFGYYPKTWPKDIRTPWFTIYSDDQGETWKQGPEHMASGRSSRSFPTFRSGRKLTAP